MPEIKFFIYKFLGLLIATPIAAYALLLTADSFEEAWKTNNRRKKWLAFCYAFFIAAVVLGWLQ